jgi:hypothetical protein
MTALKREHLVLVGPRGKQAGFQNQAKMALQLCSLELNSSDIGGGITTLLLPGSISEKNRLQSLLDRGYAPKVVIKRRHTRDEVRAAITDSLLAILGEIFYQEKGTSPRVMSAVVREFSIWITTKLIDSKPNKVRRIVEKAHPDLATRTSPDWWRKQIAQRKK